MIQRKRVLQQSGIFLKQNPGEAHLTIDELWDMAANNNSYLFMSKVSRYVANIPGTDAYWYKVREELKATVSTKGAPTSFLEEILKIHVPPMNRRGKWHKQSPHC